MGAKKIIALFGPTDPELTGPYPADNVLILRKDVNCAIPCYKVDCPVNRCMKILTPDYVMEELRKYIKKQNVQSK
jgi:heptosyltransferase-1/heptosyltransferase-2